MVKTEKIPEGYHATEAGILPVDWQVKRLSEVATELIERAGQDKYETVSISAGIGFVNQAEKFGKELSGKQYEKYIVLHQGDFSYNKGNSKTSPQGCIYRLNDRETAAVPNVFESFRIEDQNADYYEQLFLSVFLNKQLYSKINRGVRDDGLLNLTGKDFYSCAVPVPPIAEQKKIAEVLSCCDRVIELKQQLIAELQRLKSGFLQAMFPTKGHSEPDIRFPEFSDTWEQRKVSELSEKTFGGGTPKTSNDSFWKGNLPWIQSSDLIEGSLFDVEPRKYISQEAVDKSATKLVPEKSVAIVTRVGVGKLAFMPFSYATSQDFLSLSALKTEPQFTVYALYKKLQSELNAVQGTSIKGVTKDELLAKEVMIPCYKEQEKIGSYLHSLDHLITLHQQELEETKKKKKSLAKLLLTGSVRVPT